MNLRLFGELVANLLSNDTALNVQTNFENFSTNFLSLANNPANADVQKTYKDAFSIFSASLSSLSSRIDGRTLERIDTLGGRKWFSVELVEGIKLIISENALTPSLAHEEIAKLVTERSEFLSTLTDIRSSFDRLGLKPYEVDTDNPEVGFEIPRDIFGNTLIGLQKELRQLYVIIKTFQKATNSPTEPIELKTLSTSDPLIMLAIGYLALKEIGKGVTWALNTINTVNQIRDASSKTIAIDAIPENEVQEFFKPHVEKAINKAIQEKKAELLEAVDTEQHRELSSELETALRLLYARIERGMKVELRVELPPPPPEGEDGEVDDPHADIRGLANEILAIQKDIEFRELGHAPMLALTFAEEKDTKG